MLPTTLLELGLYAVISWTIGLLMGFGVGQKLDGLSEKALRHLIATVMLGLYVASVISEIFIGAYATPMFLHAIMGGIFGYLFTKSDGEFSINIGP